MGANLTLSLTIEGFIHYKTATGKSPHTIADYRSTFKKLQHYFPDNPPFAKISRTQLSAFFAWLQIAMPLVRGQCHGRAASGQPVYSGASPPVTVYRL